MKSHPHWRGAALCALLALLVTGPAMAQLQSGNVYGKVMDESGALLPGVTVTVSGGGAPAVQVTDEQGEFHFLGLSPGSYKLEAQLEGFSPVQYPSVVVGIGRNTEIELTMNAAITDTIVVSAESPLLDQRRVSITSTVDKIELEKVPSARDPWDILRTTPGVLTDRVNVGGNESGQQSNYVGPGSDGDQAIWSLEGMNITDMSATGSSVGYFDYDAFEEMQVTTGGSDATTSTGGVVLNMVTKRGNNTWRGSAHYFTADDSMQSDLSLGSGVLARDYDGAGNATNQPPFKQGNRISDIKDWGFEVGGPIVKDRLWVWGAYAKPKIQLLTVDDFSDTTELEETNFKLNAQFTPSNTATAFAWDSDKVKLGRNAGPLRPQETTWNQSKFGDKPTAWKVEDTQTFGSKFFLTGMYSHVNGGFTLAPHTGSATDIYYLDLDGISHQNAPANIEILRPQDQYKADGSTFFGSGSVSHELRFGASYREVETDTLSQTIGGAAEVAVDDGVSEYILARDEALEVKNKYTSAYAQDTLTVGNLTASFGVRYDKQGGENLPSSASANPFRPDLLPAVNYAGGGIGFEWTTLAPRVGLTYAMGAERRTLLRGSYSRYADQLSASYASWLNPVGVQTYYYYYGPTRGNGRLDLGDLHDAAGASGNWDPRNGGVLQSNAVAKGFDAPITDELLLSVEHSLRPEFMIGLSASYRRLSNLAETELLVFDGDAYSAANLNSLGRPHQASDYDLITTCGPAGGRVLPDGSDYCRVTGELRDGISTRNGFLLENGDRKQIFKGASAYFNKRLSNHWMARGNVSWQDWTWDTPASENEDPTRGLPGVVASGNNGSSTAVEDGDPVIQASGTGSGSKGNVYIQSDWSYSISAMYQVAPERAWGFNLGASVTGRQGYPQIYFERVFRGTINDGPFGVNVPVEASLDKHRLDDIHKVDFRIDKDFKISDVGLTVSAELFNAFNESYVMQRNGRLRRTNSDYVLETLSPRVFRLGVKVGFN